jgi:enoyl-CoA hydratase/carnithine racemase
MRTEGPVGELLLNRPDKLNALSPMLLEELIETAGELDADRRVEAVVLRGAGRAFSAGADLGAMRPAKDSSERRADLDRGRRAVEAIATMRPITIAAIHGHCVGGAVLLAVACDLRLAATGTRFAIPEVDLGIPLTWGGIPRLVRELGPALTKELVLTCRPFDADEAHTLRLVNRVVAPSQLGHEADALARKLASQPSYALSTTKRQVDTAAEEAASTAHSYQEAALLAEALNDRESLEAMERYAARPRD